MRQDIRDQAVRGLAGLALSSLRRGVPEAMFSLPVIKRSYVFLIVISRGFDNYPMIMTQSIEISAISCNKYTDVRLFPWQQIDAREDRMARTVGSYGPKTMEAIRKAGLRLIFEHGYAAMSLRQLASEVGIQAGSLYNHIATKQELLFDLDPGPHQRAVAPARPRACGQDRRHGAAARLRRLPRHLSHDQEARGLYRQFRAAQPGAEELRRPSSRCAAPMSSGWPTF